MRGAVLAALVIALSLPASAQRLRGVTESVPLAAIFTDDFSTVAESEDLDAEADWNKDNAGGVSIIGATGGGVLETASDVDSSAYAYVGGTTNGIDQAAKIQLVTLPTSNSEGVAVMLRRDTAAGRAYSVKLRLDGNIIIQTLSAGDFEENLNSFGACDSGTPVGGEYLWAEVSGTGTSTVWDVWVEDSDPGTTRPAGNPDCCFYVSGQAACTADVSATALSTPAQGSWVDTGNSVGIGRSRDGTYDNWAGRDRE